MWCELWSDFSDIQHVSFLLSSSLIRLGRSLGNVVLYRCCFHQAFYTVHLEQQADEVLPLAGREGHCNED